MFILQSFCIYLFIKVKVDISNQQKESNFVYICLSAYNFSPFGSLVQPRFQEFGQRGA